jgi:hypothetical protein
MGNIRLTLILPVLWTAILIGIRLDYYGNEIQFGKPTKYSYFGCLPLKLAPSDWCAGKPCPPEASEPWGCCWLTWRQRLFIFPNFLPFVGGGLLSPQATRFGQSQVTWFYFLTGAFMIAQWWMIGTAIDRRRKKQTVP